MRIQTFVEVEGFIDNNGDVIATEVEVKEPDDVVVQATIQSGATIDTIKLLGIEFIIQDPGETEFEDANDASISQPVFFGLITLDSTLIKVKDEQPANGTADEVELETP